MAKRKPYQKPQISKIKLVPEEAVLTACKVAAIGAPTNHSGQRDCKETGTCQLKGS